MIIKLNYKNTKKYFSYGQISDNLSMREKRDNKKKYGVLRKAKILKELPLEEWTKEELIDLIEMYSMYVYMVAGFNGYNIVSLYRYIYNGRYEEDSWFEELRKNK